MLLKYSIIVWYKAIYKVKILFVVQFGLGTTVSYLLEAFKNVWSFAQPLSKVVSRCHIINLYNQVSIKACIAACIFQITLSKPMTYVPCVVIDFHVVLLQPLANIWPKCIRSHQFQMCNDLLFILVIYSSVDFWYLNKERFMGNCVTHYNFDWIQSHVTQKLNCVEKVVVHFSRYQSFRSYCIGNLNNVISITKLFKLDIFSFLQVC